MSLCVFRCHCIQLWGLWPLIINMDIHQDVHPSMHRWKWWLANGQLPFLLLLLLFLVLYLLLLSLSVWGCLPIWEKGAVFGAKTEIKERNILFPRRDQKERQNGKRERGGRKEALAGVLTRRLLASCNECRSALQHYSGVFQHLNNLVSSLPLVALFVTSVDLHACWLHNLNQRLYKI